MWLFQVFHYQSHLMFHRCCHYLLLTFNYRIMKWHMHFAFYHFGLSLVFHSAQAFSILLVTVNAFFLLFNFSVLLQPPIIMFMRLSFYAKAYQRDELSAKHSSWLATHSNGRHSAEDIKKHQETSKWKIQR